MPRNGITPTYVNFIQSTPQAIVAHLYKFVSLAGAQEFFTDLDWPINYNAVVWSASGLRMDGIRRKTSVGLEVDEQSFKILALPGDTLFGSTFLTAAETGLLDGCQITRYRAVWPVVTGNLAYDVAANAPLQVWTMFTGYVSTIDKGGQSRIELKVKSPLVKLEIDMPRNYYQPGCLWTLYDAGCTLNKASFAVSGVVDAGSTLVSIPVVGGIATPIAADNIQNFAQGRILFTSGVNDGLLTLIDGNDSTNLQLAYPLVALCSPGDTFTYYPGCSKTFATCNLKFANDANFRGYDKVPPIAISI